MFKTKSSIYDETFLHKTVKGSTVNVQLGSKYASEKTETFKIKLKLAK